MDHLSTSAGLWSALPLARNVALLQENLLILATVTKHTQKQQLQIKKK